MTTANLLLPGILAVATVWLSSEKLRVDVVVTMGLGILPLLWPLAR